MKNDINFAIRYKVSNQKSSDEFTRKLLILGGCCLLAIVVSFSAIKIYNSITEHTIESINTKIDLNNSKQKLADLSEKVKKIKKYENDSIKSKKIIDSFSKYNKDIMDKILVQKPLDVAIDQINFGNNQLILICKTVNADSPVTFSKNLRNSKLFLKVEYGGFKSKPEENSYNFEVKCTLKGGATNESNR